VTILPSMTSDDGGGEPDTPGSSAPGTAMAELLPDGLVVVGPDRQVRLVNAEALRILDIPDRADLIGLPVDDVLPLTDKYGRDWWTQSDPWAGAAGRTGHLEKLLVGPRGKEVLVTARYVRSAFDGDSRVQRVMLGLRDAEARQRAERDQATVLSTVAHELRAPLTSVTGFTSSLLRRWDRFTDEQKRLMIETIESDAKRLTRLITELLDISRLDSDSLNLRLGPVDLHDLLRTHVVRHELGRANGAVRLELGASAEEQGLPEMWADADRLEQIFFNLIENALLHGAGIVTVTLDRRGDWVVVRVDDEGDGIAPSDREKIFGRFWHGPSNASTGLGLYVVRGLVEAHGGSVTVDENGAGGARFDVRLPSGLPDVVSE
jgi:signal transduction histidine kinase